MTSSRATLLLTLALAAWPTWGGTALAHPKGLYPTRAEAEHQARKLGCSGAHENNGGWMPCADEAALHHELRQR